MAKRKNLPSMKLRKTPRPQAEKTPTPPYRMLIGTPTDTALFPQEFDTLSNVKKAAVKVFANWLPWCTRFNKAGKTALEAAIGRVDLFTGTEFEPFVVEAKFDDHTDMTATVTL